MNKRQKEKKYFNSKTSNAKNLKELVTGGKIKGLNASNASGSCGLLDRIRSCCCCRRFLLFRRHFVSRPNGRFSRRSHQRRARLAKAASARGFPLQRCARSGKMSMKRDEMPERSYECLGISCEESSLRISESEMENKNVRKS